MEENKDVDLTVNGMATLNLEPNGAANAVVFASPDEQRSSSAMAEYRVDGYTAMAAGATTGGNLPHSVSSPSLTILGQQLLQHQPLSPAASQPNLRSLLPAYRAAPDYETAVRVKYGDDIAQLLLNPAPAPPVTPPVQQQPQQMEMNMYKPPPPYPYSKVDSNSSPNLAAVVAPQIPGDTAVQPMLLQMEAHQHLHQPPALIRNGEPIYQNIPLRQPGSQTNLSAASTPPSSAQSSGQTRRKWGLPVRSSARSAVISRVQQPASPSSSPASKRSVDSAIPSSSTFLHQPLVTPNVKDHLVINKKSAINPVSICILSFLYVTAPRS